MSPEARSDCWYLARLVLWQAVAMAVVAVVLG